MTNKQRDALLRSAMADLRKTEKGYKEPGAPQGPNWSNAFRKLNQLQADLGRAPIPALGPILEGGPSLLTYSPTHNTDGVPGHPAFDAAFNQKGRWVIAPERMTIQDEDGSGSGTEGFDAIGASGIGYWVGHLFAAPPVGRTFTKGQRLGRIGDLPGTDHVHWGLDVRPLTGQSLKYGRNGNGPDYTFGSPSIGTQLRRMLEG